MSQEKHCFHFTGIRHTKQQRQLDRPRGLVAVIYSI
eukprot:COSAG05_NODE_1239_length_5425_cov_3.841532_4_plen_36_part_00